MEDGERVLTYPYTTGDYGAEALLGPLEFRTDDSDLQAYSVRCETRQTK